MPFATYPALLSIVLSVLSDRLSVPEYKIVILHVDDYRMLTVDLLSQYVFRELVEHKPLYRTLHGTCAEFGIIAVFGKKVKSLRCDLKSNAVRGKHPADAVDLYTHDVENLTFVERGEHHSLIDTVQELGTDNLLQTVHDILLRILDNLLLLLLLLVAEALEIATYNVAAHIGRHDDDGILEVDETAFVIGQSSVVKHL